MKSIALCILMVAGVIPIQDIQKRLIDLSGDVEFAVLPIWKTNSVDMGKSQVIGTGFLVTRDGYFVTAAHVLADYTNPEGPITAVSRQRSRDGRGTRFDIIERDIDHDVALCKIQSSLKFVERKDNPGTEYPIAALHVADRKPLTGQFIAIAGFPLGSWEPAVQLGTVAAIRTTNPNAGRVPAGQRELLQISASGNKGNSGSPVIALDSGDVIGVIIQAEPAPLYSTQDLPFAQSSGIMLAVPATWLRDLLKRHGVKSIAQRPPAGHTSYYPLPTHYP